MHRRPFIARLHLSRTFATRTVRHVFPTALIVISAACSAMATPAGAQELAVVATDPARHSTASAGTAVAIEFDRPVDPATLDAASVRVFGHWSGTASGSLSALGEVVTFVPDAPFSAGETVFVTLSHDLAALDSSPMRSAGYAYTFNIATAPGDLTFEEIDVLSNRIGGAQTRIYGANASDLDEDGFLDLATVNEVSADVRVFLNRGDGSGLYEPMLTPEPIGIEASPNQPADFDNDGHTDLCIGASSSNEVWVLLGNGDGTFGSSQSIAVGSQPHGVVALDVDGDGDWDIVNANNGTNNLSLMLNDGNGVFSAPSFFDAGVNGEYGVAVGDMDSDGVLDLVVGARDGQRIVTLLGNGNGTFDTTVPSQSSGGSTWVVALGDLDGDGDLDASTANSVSNHGAILKGNGDGTFGPPTLMNTNNHTVSSDLGDLDGDGDADWVLSSFGGGFWRVYTNDGSGNFAFHQQIDAPNNPSCAVLYDSDNDGDLDMALTDEIADVVILMRNMGPVTSAPDLTDPAHPSGPKNSIGQIRAVPNPASGPLRLRFHRDPMGTAAQANASVAGVLEVFSPSGRRLAHRDVVARVGANEYVFDLADDTGRRLPGGSYSCRLTLGNGSVVWGGFTLVR